MRRFIIGLLAALMAASILPAAAFAADAPAKTAPVKVDPEAKTKGMAAAPGIITSAGLDCQLADARLIGTSNDPKTKISQNYYELACKGAEGFVVSVPVKAGTGDTLAYTCLEVALAKGATCVLPENADPKAGIAALVSQDQPNCQMTNARGLGHNATVTVLEVACQGGAGYIVDASYPLSLSKPATFNPCAGITAGMSIQCTLTDAATTNAYIAALVAKMGKPCDMKDHRYVGADSKGVAYFEVACQDGKGYMMEVAANGGVAPIDCAVADGIGGGCTLTNSRAAETEQAGLYSKLAHNAGFACEVSKYGLIPANVPAGHEVVELACSNRPDGGVGVFAATAAEKSVVYNCAVSELVGYRCSFTKPDAAFPQLTNDLKALGKTTCVVSGERLVGTTPDKLGYIEVTCADGNPGYVISYTLATMAPKEALTCSFAKDIAGGCQMPQNTKKS
jgi:hypothetical protein